MFVCELSGVAPDALHAWHVILHAGLAVLVSSVGSGFLGMGILAKLRARRPRTA